MKKNLVPNYLKNTYLMNFLPLVEVILSVKQKNFEPMILNKKSLALYFDLDEHTIADFLKQAEKDEIIKFYRKAKVFDDKVFENLMCEYFLPEDEIYGTKLRAFINSYLLWELDYCEKFKLFSEFTKKVEKLQAQKSDYQKSAKQLEKEAKNEAYQKAYYWALDLEAEINTDRDDIFKSSYLAEGKNREVNILCTTKNPEKKHTKEYDPEVLQLREKLLEEFFEGKKAVEFDSNGSIYRLSYNLNTKNLLSHKIDIYDLFWRYTKFDVPFDSEIRAALKVVCMPIFMGNGSRNHYNAILLKNNKKLSASDQAKLEAQKFLSEITGYSELEVLEEITAAMKKCIKAENFLKDKIFIHESNLHLLILIECKKRGIKAINVYDGFYFAEGTMDQQTFDQIYDQCTLELLALIEGETL